MSILNKVLSSLLWLPTVSSLLSCLASDFARYARNSECISLTCWNHNLAGFLWYHHRHHWCCDRCPLCQYFRYSSQSGRSHRSYHQAPVCYLLHSVCCRDSNSIGFIWRIFRKASCLCRCRFMCPIRYGRSHPFLLFSSCNAMIAGGFTVLSTKAVSTLLTMEWFEMFTEWITYPVIVVRLFQVNVNASWVKMSCCRY